MNLFTINHQLYSTSLNPLRLETPLGNLFFNCQIFSKSLLVNQHTKIKSFKLGSIASWISDNYIAEFIKFNFIPKLPMGMRIDECIFAAWRIKSLGEVVKCNFNCNLENNLEGSPESGEGLIAQSFENEHYKLSIGTEDEEYLQRRAELQYWLPHQFKAKISADQMNYLHNGIEVTPPELPPNERLQIHFIVSWSSKKNTEIATWYAVDQSPKEIIEAAGIK